MPCLLFRHLLMTSVLLRRASGGSLPAAPRREMMVEHRKESKIFRCLPRRALGCQADWELQANDRVWLDQTAAC